MYEEIQEDINYLFRECPDWFDEDTYASLSYRILAKVIRAVYYKHGTPEVEEGMIVQARDVKNRDRFYSQSYRVIEVTESGFVIAFNESTGNHIVRTRRDVRVV